MWELNHKEHWRIDAFELWCWIKLSRVPWTARRSNQSILREISPEYSLERLMLKLMLSNWCWRRLLRVSWKARRSNQSILNQPWILIGMTDAEAKAPVLWPSDVKSWLTGKDPNAWKDWGQKRVIEDDMVGWYHWINGHEFQQQALGNSEGKGSLACCSP